MANLNTKTLAAGVGDILAVADGIDDTTARQIKDGDGTVSPLYITTARLGISVAAPLCELHIGGTNPQIRIGDDDAEDTSLCFMGNAQDFYIALDDTTDDLTIGTGTTIGSNVKMVVENAGNVGIGNTVPGNLLEISKVDGNATLELSSWSTTDTYCGTLMFHKSAISTLNTYGTNSHTAAGEKIGRIEAWGVTNEADTSDAPVLSSYIEFAGDATADPTDAPGKILFATAAADDDGTPTVRMAINDDGNVGIGTDAPARNLEVALVESSPIIQIFRQDGAILDGEGIGELIFAGGLYGTAATRKTGAYIAATADGAWVSGASSQPTKMTFYTQNATTDASSLSTPRMNITKDGYIGIGIAAPANTLSVVTPLGASAADLEIVHFDHTSSTDGNCLGIGIDFSAADPDDETQYFLKCEDQSAVRFKIHANGDYWSQDGGEVTSDERLKENIVDATSKLDDINKLKVRNFNFRETDKETGQKIHSSESASRKRIGFIAQEFEGVFPGLVKESEIISAREAVEAKDAVLDSEGGVIEEAIEAKPERKQLIRKNLKLDALVSMLIKAIQELSAKVTALENA